MSQVDFPLRASPDAGAPDRAAAASAARRRRGPASRIILGALATVARPRRRARPLAAAFGVVYLTFAALLLVDPQPVLDWLDDFEPSPLVSTLRSSVGAVAAVSDAIGLSRLSAATRSRIVPFLKRPEGPSS